MSAVDASICVCMCGNASADLSGKLSKHLMFLKSLKMTYSGTLLYRRRKQSV